MLSKVFHPSLLWLKDFFFSYIFVGDRGNICFVVRSSHRRQCTRSREVGRRYGGGQCQGTVGGCIGDTGRDNIHIRSKYLTVKKNRLVFLRKIDDK